MGPHESIGNMCVCTFFLVGPILSKFQVVLGTFALWFGWYGFNPGSTLTMKSGSDGALAAQVAMNTTLAAATGGITVFLLRYVITHKYDVGALCNGILAGLVSITAGCGNMESGSAFATGLIGGGFCSNNQCPQMRWLIIIFIIQT